MNILSLFPIGEQVGIGAYWFIFFIALSEALVLIGSLIPGAVGIMIVGFLAARGYFNLAAVILCATAGAIAGDVTSYYLGIKGTQLFKKENKVFNTSHLKAGEEFFAKYGNKSILFGRFVGPLRAIVPFVAGLSRMDKRTFVIWDIASGFSWAIAYVLLGYFFGGTLSVLEGWITRISFILFVIFVGVVIWFIKNQQAKKTA